MPVDPQKTFYFKQARFTTRLPTEYRYAPSHYWLYEVEPGLFRVGLTRFATRMLGDFVEHKFDVRPGQQIHVGQTVGWVEGFKAVADVYCVIGGEFVGDNPQLGAEPELVDRDPYDLAWLYLARGEPAGNIVGVEGYVAILNQTIESMLAQEQNRRDPNC